jgi:hypothetical protein
VLKFATLTITLLGLAQLMKTLIPLIALIYLETADLPTSSTVSLRCISTQLINVNDLKGISELTYTDSPN